MGVRILEGNESFTSGAVLVCSTTGTAFGPLMQDGEEAEKFLEFLGTDARSFTDAELKLKYSDFLNDTKLCDTCAQQVPHVDWKEHQEDHSYEALAKEVA